MSAGEEIPPLDPRVLDDLLDLAVERARAMERTEEDDEEPEDWDDI